MNALDLNANPKCLTDCQIGDHGWVDNTLYEVYAFEGTNVLLRWSQPLRIRNCLGRTEDSPEPKNPTLGGA